MEGGEEKVVKYDEIKKLLNLPEFTGIRFTSSYCRESFKFTLPEGALTSRNMNSIPAILLRDDQDTVQGSGDHHGVDHSLNVEARALTKRSTSAAEKENVAEIAKNLADTSFFVDPDLLSGYEEYLREFNGSSQVGSLRVTSHGTIALCLSHNMQVDVSINGAFRIVNPKAHIALSVNFDGTAAAIMHPLGRVHHDGDSALLMAFDMKNEVHKFAKLWPDKSSFKSNEMSFSYSMDSAGTRTSMSNFPLIPSSDISLPVFYNTSPHGAQFKVQAETLMKAATQQVDAQGNAVWNINNIIVKFLNGELRVIKHPSTFVRTSATSGCLSLSTEKLHCTATQGEMCHFFARFGENKMHYDGQNFKIRTSGQSAGFDENNRITLF